MNKLSTLVKIFFALLCSYIVVTIITPLLFVSNSPKINSTFVDKVKNAPTYIAQLPLTLSTYIQGLVKKSTQNNEFAEKTKELPVTNDMAMESSQSLKSITPPPNTVFTSIAKGVAASEEKEGKVILKIDQGTEYKYQRFQLPDGRIIDILDLSGN